MLDNPRGVSAHDLGEVTVYATSEEGAEAAPPETEIEGAIAFTKEVQWRIPFITAPATMEELAETVPVTVDVQMQPQAEAIVSAPVDGIVRAPRVYSSGSFVRRGQTLASISSTLGGGEDVATLEFAVNEASIARDAAARCPPRGPAVVGTPSETLFWAETWLRGRPRRRRLAHGGRGVEDATMANSDHDSGPGGSRAVAAAARPRRTWPLGWSGARSVAPTIDDADHSDWEGSN